LRALFEEIPERAFVGFGTRLAQSADLAAYAEIGEVFGDVEAGIEVGGCC